MSGPRFLGPKTFNPHLSTSTQPASAEEFEDPPSGGGGERSRKPYSGYHSSSDEHDESSSAPSKTSTRPLPTSLAVASDSRGDYQSMYEEEKKLKERAVAAVQAAEIDLRKCKERMAKAAQMSKSQLAIVQQQKAEAVTALEATVDELKLELSLKSDRLIAVQAKLKAVLEETGRTDSSLPVDTEGVVPLSKAQELMSTIESQAATIKDLKSRLSVLSALPSGSDSPVIDLKPKAVIMESQLNELKEELESESKGRQQALADLRTLENLYKTSSATSAATIASLTEANARLTQKLMVYEGDDDAGGSVTHPITRGSTDSSEVTALKIDLSELTQKYAELLVAFKELESGGAKGVNSLAVKSGLSPPPPSPTDNAGSDAADLRKLQEKYSTLKAEYKRLQNENTELATTAKQKIAMYRDRAKAAEAKTPTGSPPAVASEQELAIMRENVGKLASELERVQMELETARAREQEIIAQATAQIEAERTQIKEHYKKKYSQQG